MSAKVWLSCSTPRPLVCQVRYTVSPSRRNTLTANPSPGAASTSAAKELSDDEYQSILLPTLALYASASSIGPLVTMTNRASFLFRNSNRVNCDVKLVHPPHCHSAPSDHMWL